MHSHGLASAARADQGESQRGSISERSRSQRSLQAEEGGRRLVYRDWQHDHCRSCAEYANSHGVRCLQGRHAVGDANVYTLHRHTGFKPSEFPSASHKGSN